MEVTITTENFESYKNGELPLVVDLWATWCGPCRVVAPIVSQLAEEFDGKVVVGKCDVEENDDIAMEFGVRNIPTMYQWSLGHTACGEMFLSRDSHPRSKHEVSQ